MRYFTSDPHFGHKNVIVFERTRFKTPEEHDVYLLQQYMSWAKKLKKDDELYVLGDWGDTFYLWIMTQFKCKTIFVYGNHDKQADKPLFAKAFDEVHEYPIWLSNKLVVSHIPVAVWEDTVNIHGHLHGSVLDSNNYINCSIHVADYGLISEKKISSNFSKIPTYDRRFLWEPFADLYKFTQPKEDAVYNKDCRIDLSASRVIQKMKKEA